MNSTDSDRERTLEMFFKTRIVPAAACLAAQGVRLIPPHREPELDTYYIRRRRRSMDRGDFELTLGDMAEVKRRLLESATGPEKMVLGELAGRVLDLAELFTDVQATEEVSPFIYVMY